MRWRPPRGVRSVPRILRPTAAPTVLQGTPNGNMLMPPDTPSHPKDSELNQILLISLANREIGRGRKPESDRGREIHVYIYLYIYIDI